MASLFLEVIPLCSAVTTSKGDVHTYADFSLQILCSTIGTAVKPSLPYPSGTQTLHLAVLWEQRLNVFLV